MTYRNWLTSSIVASFVLVASAMAADAAQLVMIDSKACVYCARWNKEVGSIYANTPEGRIAPLRRVTYRNWPSDLRHIRREPSTPTFILVDNGKEVARIRGYASKEWFWKHLRSFIRLLPGH